jgi:hypothetical protein
MTTFVIVGVVIGIMSLIFWTLVALMLDTWGQRLMALIFTFFIWLLLTLGIVAQTTQDQKNWNDGYCTECGGEYKFSGASQHRRNHDYFYSCVECDHTIKVETIKK